MILFHITVKMVTALTLHISAAADFNSLRWGNSLNPNDLSSNNKGLPFL